MCRMFPEIIAAAFRLAVLGLLGSMILGFGVQASEMEKEIVAKRSAWNNLVSRGPWHEIVARQVSSGNRTADLYDFFSPNDPPAPCALQCELIWGAVTSCDLRSCLCTDQWGSEFVRCVNCLAPQPTSSQRDYYQGILTEFQIKYCLGYGLSPLVLDAGSGSSVVGTPTSPGGPAGANSPTGIAPSPTFLSASGGSSISPHILTTFILACLVTLSFW